MMMGMTERDNPIMDSLIGFIGFVVFPFIRMSWRKQIVKYKEEHLKRELPNWP